MLVFYVCRTHTTCKLTAALSSAFQLYSKYNLGTLCLKSGPFPLSRKGTFPEWRVTDKICFSHWFYLTSLPFPLELSGDVELKNVITVILSSY